jgi:lipid A 3-O-deacylase
MMALASAPATESLNNLDLGLKLQHFSNGGIKDPNDGVNFAVVRISYPF